MKGITILIVVSINLLQFHNVMADNGASAIIPGASLAGTSVHQISRGLSSRSVTVEISNYLNVSLKDPKMHCTSGHNKIPPPFSVRPGYREAFAFIKTKYSLRGAVCVFSYQVGTGQRFAVLTSVPYNQIGDGNHFGAAIMDSKQATDEHLLYNIHHNTYYSGNKYHWVTPHAARPASEGRPVTITGAQFTVNVVMSDSSVAVAKVDVYCAHGQSDCGPYLKYHKK